MFHLMKHIVQSWQVLGPCQLGWPSQQATESKQARMFTSALLPRLFGNNVPGHTIREPQVGFELVTNGIIANLDKTSLKNGQAN